MKRALIIAAAIALSTTFSGAPAVAGGWDRHCGGCMFDGYEGRTQIAPPSYVYAPPTVTIVPQYIVQPNLIVRRTYVLRPTQVLEEAAAPCMSSCGGEYVVDQGQFYGRPAGYQHAVIAKELQAPGRYYIPSYRHRGYGYPQRPRFRHDGYRRFEHYRRVQ